MFGIAVNATATAIEKMTDGNASGAPPRRPEQPERVNRTERAALPLSRLHDGTGDTGGEGRDQVKRRRARRSRLLQAAVLSLSAVTVGLAVLRAARRTAGAAPADAWAGTDGAVAPDRMDAPALGGAATGRGRETATSR